MKKKIIYISIFIILVTLGVIFVTAKRGTLVVNYKCPESYTEDNAGTMEYKKALAKWSIEFFKSNPKADISDWSIAKTNYWKENNCIEAIRRSKLSGYVADLKPWEKVDYEFQVALDKTGI